MADLIPTDNPQNDKPDPSSKKPSPPPQKQETGGGNNAFWYLLIGVILVAVAIQFTNSSNRKEIKFSVFEQKLKTGDWNNKNTNEVKFNMGVLSFQDKPKTESGADAEDTNYYRVATQNITEDRLTELQELLVAKNIDYDSSVPASHWQETAIYMLFLISMLVIFFIILRRLGGAGSAMSFGRSRGKLYAQEDLGITFEDVAGADEAIQEVKEFVEFLKTPEKFQALGGRIPHGVLLVGPPGTGKTLLAKAVAGEAGVPFFGLSGSDFVEMFVGVGAARVRDMFSQAAQRSPSIIFIDELDALGKVRGSGYSGGGHDEREQTLNALLVEMDGFASDQNVIVMAATNRPETLDPALKRPGRFDRQVLVDRPDVKGREAILKVHAHKVKLDEDVDLTRLAKLCPGFCGADLANLVNEGALLAARAGKKLVTMEELEEGIERVVAGLEKQNRLMQDDEKLRVAYHECGHALAACSLPHTDPVHKISIIPRGFGALGYTMQHPDDERFLSTESELKNRICVLLGGTIAEEIVYKEISNGATSDLQRASDIARRMVTDFGMSPKLGRVHYTEMTRSPFLEGSSTGSDAAHSEDTMREIDLEVRRIIDECLEMTRDILTARREVLEHLTKELMEVEVMNADELNAILEQYKTSPQISHGTFVDSSSSEQTSGEVQEPEQDNTAENS